MNLLITIIVGDIVGGLILHHILSARRKNKKALQLLNEGPTEKEVKTTATEKPN